MEKRLARILLAALSSLLILFLALLYHPHVDANTLHPQAVYIGARYSIRSRSPISLRVGTYNAKHFSQGSHNFAQYAAIVRDAKLDVLGIQEVDKNTNRSNHLDEAKLLAEELGWHYYFAPAISLEGGEYGLAILSRYPIEAPIVHKYASTDAEQRILTAVTINVDGISIRILNTHLSPDLHDPANGIALREGQFAQLSSITDSLSNYILLGDLNTDTPTELAQAPHIRWVNAAERMLITCPVGNAAIDNIGTGQNGKFSNITVMPSPLSDHNLLYADVTILAAK